MEGENEILLQRVLYEVLCLAYSCFTGYLTITKIKTSTFVTDQLLTASHHTGSSHLSELASVTVLATEISTKVTNACYLVTEMFNILN